MLGVWLICPVSVALGQNRFQPTVIHILGSNQVGDPLPLSRLFTQKAGELAIGHWEFRDIGLCPNIPKIFEMLLQPVPVGNVLTVAIGFTIIRAAGVVNLSQSHPPFEYLVEFLVTEGSTYPIPVGSRLASFVSRSQIENGTSVVTTVLDFTPGLLPEITPSPISICGQQTPGVLKNPPRPSTVRIETTMVSVRPHDGSDPIVRKSVQNIEIVDNPALTLREEGRRLPSREGDFIQIGLPRILTTRLTGQTERT